MLVQYFIIPVGIYYNTTYCVSKSSTNLMLY